MSKSFLFWVLTLLFLFSAPLNANNSILVSVDPADRLMNATVLGEWNTPGNFEGWTGNDVSGLTVTGGYITGTGTASSPSIQKTNISGGPDLDFGYVDYLQIRIQVPSSFNDDIIFYFGTSVNGGFSSERMFSIPAASVVKDGNWHAYRLDLGLVVYWRDTLEDMRIHPLGNSGNGQTFYIDYVEVGDLPDDILLRNENLNFYTGETLQDCSYMESKHGCFWWSPQSYVENPDFNPTVMGRRALRMVEESYQVYTKKLGYEEPCQSWDLWRRDGNRYKTNHTTWWGGFWMGGYEGWGYFNVPGYGLYDEGWGNPTPHEYGHVVQGHNLGNLTGGHWESHANYLQDNRDTHYGPLMGGHPSNIGTNPFEMSNYRQDHGRLIYADYRVHYAISDYAGDLGQPWDLAAQLWREGTSGYTVYDKLATLLTGGANVQDTVAFGLRHWPFLDFASGDEFKAVLWSTADNKAWWYYITGALLIPSQDRAGWYRVPFERAPERFAYIYHELVPTTTNITVEVQNIDLLGSTEDLRWSLVAMDTSENLRFSSLYSPGTQSMSLDVDETKVYLVVMATPTDTDLNLEYADNRFAPDKHADRLHYAYEVRLVNCSPATSGRQLNKTESPGHYHSNGGGWVADSATVHSTAYVGPNARVLGTSKVYNYARIEDYAIVMGNATVQDYAIVSGYAVVRDNAIVRNYARVRDRGVVADSSVIENNGLVEDYAHLYGSTNVKDSGIIRGSSMPWDTVASGTAICGYDYSMAETVSDGVHFSHIPWGGWYRDYYVVTKKKPRGLVASYRVEETEGAVCWDEFGTQHSILLGSPSRIEDTTMAHAVLRFDGTDDYMVLDRSLCDSMAGTFGLWVNPTDNTDRPVLFMGSSASKYLKLELDSTGKAKFTITDGSTTNTVTSTTTIPASSWTHIAVTLSGSQAAIYVNGGTPEATTSSTLVPLDVLGSNDYTVAEGLYVGRDWAGSLYAGDLEDMRFYNVALTQAEIENEIRRAGNVLGVFYWGIEQNFTNTEVQSGVHNGVGRILEAEIYPDTSQDVAYYEGIFDCTDERDSAYEGSGFGLDNREILVRLDNVGFWRTGVYVTLGTWQKITVAFDGSTAELYVNDQPMGTTYYSANADNVAGKNYRIGFAMDTSSTKYYYDGKIRNAMIYETPVGAELPPGLIALYKFEGNVDDSSGNNNNGTAYGGPTYVSGKIGQAIDLYGDDDYVQIPAGVASSEDITVATWVNWDGGGSWQRIFDFGNNTTQNMFLSPMSGSNTLRFAITTSGGGGEQQLNTTVLSTGQWVHVAVTLNGDVGKLYVNGTPVDTQTITLNPSDFSPQLNYIGKSQYADPYLDGRLDDFRIYNYALTDGQIADLALKDSTFDDFSYTKDFLTEGVSGTIWDGFVGLGTGETVDALNSNIGRPGQLFMQSTNGAWVEPWDSLGPFLYKIISGDFVADIEVTDYEGTPELWIYHNNCGLMARASKSPDEGGTGEDWVSIDYFPIWSCGNYVRSADNDVRTENCHNGLQWDLHPFMQLEKSGNNFSMRTSTDRTSWTEMSCSPLTRTDLGSLSLQVGLFQATYSTSQGYAAFDDFRVESAVGDTDPPTPNPATWATVPYAVSSSEISMTATTGSDESPPVEYYFEELTGNPGGSDSGWVTDPIYNDTDLQAGTQYTYRVRMRDSLLNTGEWSTSESATTQQDTTPPTPNPATWATVPYAVSSSEISMTATTGSDESPPVEYYFEELTGNPGGDDSGWVTDPIYNDTDLQAGTQYTYRVRMRDSLLNTGNWSTSESATTPSGGQVFYDSFEVSEWNGLWTEDSQNDWFRSTQRATQGSYSAEVDGYANNATLTSIIIDLQGNNDATVTFDWFIERGLDSGEYLAFDVSTDGGSEWIQKAILQGNIDTENVWHNESIDVTNISSGNLRIRFRGKMSQSNEDADVDNVKVVAW